MSSKRNTIIVAALVGAGAAGYFAFLSSPPVDAVASHPPPLAFNATSLVGALGRIEPASEIIDIGGPADEQLVRLTVQEGDQVEKGQTLGYLRSYSERSAGQALIAAKLLEAEHLLEAATRSGEAAIREAEVKLMQIEATYPLRIAAQEATVNGLQVNLANARDILTTRKTLYQSRNQSKRSVYDQQAAVDKLMQDLSSESSELSRLRREMPIEKQLAQSALDRAKADLIRSQAEIGVESLRRELSVMDAQTKAATLTAPIAGTILKVQTFPGERLGEGPVLTMGDTTDMHAVAEVYETDIERVRMGQTATVSSKALSKSLSGKVVKVGRMIFKNDVLGVDPASKIDARIIEVRIKLEESERVAALTNLSVDVVIDSNSEPSKTAPVTQGE